MREIRTIETDRYEKTGDTGLLTHVGMITGREAFDQLRMHLEDVGLLPDEYFLPSIYEDEMNQELPKFRTAVCHTDWFLRGTISTLTLCTLKTVQRNSFI